MTIGQLLIQTRIFRSIDSSRDFFFIFSFFILERRKKYKGRKKEKKECVVIQDIKWSDHSGYFKLSSLQPLLFGLFSLFLSSFLSLILFSSYFIDFEGNIFSSPLSLSFSLFHFILFDTSMANSHQKATKEINMSISFFLSLSLYFFFLSLFFLSIFSLSLLENLWSFLLSPHHWRSEKEGNHHWREDTQWPEWDFFFSYSFLLFIFFTSFSSLFPPLPLSSLFFLLSCISSLRCLERKKFWDMNWYKRKGTPRRR